MACQFALLHLAMRAPSPAELLTNPTNPPSTVFSPVSRMPRAPTAAWLTTRPFSRAPSGEELDQQLVDTVGLVVMDPVRRIGEAFDAVAVVVDHSGRGPYTDRGICTLLAVLGRRVDVPHVHPHRFRHDTARRLVEHVDPPTVATLLGHSRLDAVRIYAQPDEATLERAAELLARA